ncbi:glycosyl hydrolase family 32 [Actinomyces urogenitalis DSM 15434]|uniref:beta-fructofuranosidase n=1 Tax=Actinomyces urogenitalis DSM 15434 TaxID=525246 RepID=C0W7Z7_9ACTO|nr:fructan beta-fructosidase [Actinomyces urogenitalis]EEH65157.1 glycosyl hydrolase family 32 [Actinomyces urogenitalis DSM 15434]MDK8835524.1 fructan beta-fructosidase [Actinomyces urogenitalis]
MKHPAITPRHSLEIDRAQMRERSLTDPLRPLWHITPPWGWLNDPNGLLVHPGPDGQDILHVFYQHNSHAPVHELIEWGHQWSDDLVHWHDLPVALTPGPAGADALGCWSGVIVEDERSDGRRVPTMVYSGHDGGPTQNCCVAVAREGDPLLRSWDKDVANPVIESAPQSVGADLPEMRDHTVWREAGRWYQVMGSGLPGQGKDGAQGGAALCFSSPDLREWTYEGPLAVGDGDVSATGTIWECPDLMRLEGPDGEVDVLTVAAWHQGDTMRSMWMVGQREGTRMTIERTGRMDLGENYFYAPQSLRLPDGRRVVIGWMQPNGTQEQRVAAGWAGSMNIPREVVLAQDGTVRFFPIREIDSLHLGEPVRLEGEEVDGAQLSGRSLDLRIAGVLGEAPIELDLLASQDGSCATRITLSRRQAKGMSGQEAWTGWLSVDRSSAADADSPWRGEDTRLLQGPVPLGSDGVVEMRVLLDRSSLEVFVDGQPLSVRVGADPSHDQVRVRAVGLEHATLRAWQMSEAYTSGRLEA